MEWLSIRWRIAALATLLALLVLALLPPAGGAYAQVREAEPNNDTATANGPFPTDATVTGSVSRDDLDFFEIEVTSASTYRFETPDDDGGFGCASHVEDPVLQLYDSRGAHIDRDDDGGPGSCARLVRRLPAGTYFVSIEPYTEEDVQFPEVIPNYVLEIDRDFVGDKQCSDGLDNDSDGQTDFTDQGCESAEDDSESPAAAVLRRPRQRLRRPAELPQRPGLRDRPGRLGVARPAATAQAVLGWPRQRPRRQDRLPERSRLLIGERRQRVQSAAR